MADDPEVVPADDKPTLDSIIDDAITASEQEAPVEADSPKIDATGRLHGEKGRFVPKDASTEQPSDGTAEVEVAPAETQEPDPALQPIEAPRNFTAEQKAAFANLPREAQEFVSQAEKAREADYTRKAQEVSEFRRAVDPYVKAVQPFAQYLAQVAPAMGTTPAGAVNQILAAEYKLRTGNVQEKYGAFVGLAQHYGVDLAALANGRVPVQPQPRQVDPQLNQRLSRIEQGIQQEQMRQLSLQIDSFQTAKDEQGKPKYPHFQQVRASMAHSLASGEANTLEDAYAVAVKPIKEAIAAELSARQKTEETKRQEALEKARKAAPVKASGTQPRGLVSSKGLDNIISAAIDKAGIH